MSWPLGALAAAKEKRANRGIPARDPAMGDGAADRTQPLLHRWPVANRVCAGVPRAREEEGGRDLAGDALGMTAVLASCKGLRERRLHCPLPGDDAQTEQQNARRRGLQTRACVRSGVPHSTPVQYSRQPFVMGSRRSRPKARGVILTPGGACRRLYSLRSTVWITRRTNSSSNPADTISARLRSSST